MSRWNLIKEYADLTRNHISQQETCNFAFLFNSFTLQLDFGWTVQLTSNIKSFTVAQRIVWHYAELRLVSIFDDVQPLSHCYHHIFVCSIVGVRIYPHKINMKKKTRKTMPIKNRVLNLKKKRRRISMPL